MKQKSDLIISCDKCGALMDKTKTGTIRSRTFKMNGDDIVDNYLYCEKCKAEYHINYTSSKIRKMQSQYKKHISQAQNKLAQIKEESAALEKKINDYRKKLPANTD